MTANLDAVDLGPDVVCMVDHPVRQPQQALLDGFKVPRVRSVHCLFARLFFKLSLQQFWAIFHLFEPENLCILKVAAKLADIFD